MRDLNTRFRPTQLGSSRAFALSWLFAAAAACPPVRSAEGPWLVLLSSQRDFAAAMKAAKRFERTPIRLPLTYPRLDLSTRYEGLTSKLWIVVGGRFATREKAQTLVSQLKEAGVACYAKRHQGVKEEHFDSYPVVRTFALRVGERVPAFEALAEDAEPVMHLPDGEWYRVVSQTMGDVEQWQGYQVELSPGGKRVWLEPTTAFYECDVVSSPAKDHAVLSYLTGAGRSGTVVRKTTERAE